MNIQVPPNLSYERLSRLLSAGINDWGGVSPVTPGSCESGGALAASRCAGQRDARRGRMLVERLADLPRLCAADRQNGSTRACGAAVMAEIDTCGLVRREAGTLGSRQCRPTQTSRPAEGSTPRA